jgi:hypothetical protein
MKLKILCLCWMGVTPLFLSADVIALKNGTRIDGKILAENEDSLEIEIGKNETGTIRRVLIIHSSEIASWAADQEGRMLKESGGEVHRLGGTAYIERLLQEAEGEIGEGQYDRGIQQFGEAADLAVSQLDGLAPADKAEALKIRAHALRLQLAALEGKSEWIDKKNDGVVEEMDSARKKLEKEIEELKDAKADFQNEREKENIQLGQRHKQNDLVKREEELLQKQYLFKERQAAVEKGMAEFEKEQVKTKTQIKLVQERVDQAEDDAKAAERELRKR